MYNVIVTPLGPVQDGEFLSLLNGNTRVTKTLHNLLLSVYILCHRASIHTAVFEHVSSCDVSTALRTGDNVLLVFEIQKGCMMLVSIIRLITVVILF